MRKGLTEDEIREEIDKANTGAQEGSRYTGLSFEEGVIAALRWVLGDVKNSPMDDM